MKKILLLAIGLMLLVGSVSAYGLYIACPQSIQVGDPLKCTVDSDFPAGTSFDLVFYQSQYTATQINSQPVVIQDDHATQYILYDTAGLPGGQYKVEVHFNGPQESSLRSDSVTSVLVTLQDRSGEITITSPSSQPLASALRIEGSIAKKGNSGVQIKVTGPDGTVFPQQYIETKNNPQNGAGVFSKQVLVGSPGDYDVSFSDPDGFIGTISFLVTAPATITMATVPVTVATSRTTRPVTTVPTPWPTATKSPLSPVTITGALALAGIFLTRNRRRP